MCDEKVQATSMPRETAGEGAGIPSWSVGRVAGWVIC